LQIEKIDHIHVYVRDLRAAIARFEDLLGVTFGDIMVEGLEDLGVIGAFAPPGIDMSQPTSPQSPVAKVIERHGEGLVGGVSFKVPDIDAGVAELQSKGLQLLNRIQIGGLKEAWFHPGNAHGLLIELCEYNEANALEAVSRRDSGTSEPSE